MDFTRTQIAALSGRIGAALQALPAHSPLLQRLVELRGKSTTTREAQHNRTLRNLKRSLNIPAPEFSAEDAACQKYQQMGQFLARQDRWDDLGAMIRHHDRARDLTTGGSSIAELLCFGARQDLVGCIEAALSDPGLMPQHAPVCGLDALDGMLREHLQEHPQDYGTALVVAHAHIDVGWAFRGSGWPQDILPSNWQAFQVHFARASEILDQFDPFSLDAPGLAAARCALLAAQQSPETLVCDDYEDLIDLDPTNAAHIRAMGNHLLPRWFGSYKQLEQEARRASERTADIWGDGAYCWAYLDAITVDPQTLAHVDTGRFLSGLNDILNRRKDQHTANQLAAFCAITLAQPRYMRAHLTENRAKLARAIDAILKQHLREIHPLTWQAAAVLPGHPPTGEGTETPREQGLAMALAHIGGHFQDELQQGHSITFSDQGLQIG